MKTLFNYKSLIKVVVIMVVVAFMASQMMDNSEARGKKKRKNDYNNTSGGGQKGSGKDCCPIDDLPSRIAGDSGTDSGDWWSTSYTDAANATDGDYSTFAYGSATGDGTGENKEVYITWDMGEIYDISIVMET